ncbi:recombinase family protein [Belnapia rosea]|uniref:Site-specific DNA recombinase n=1 Tax=Belnapia rosea TaxID=938405 RepID=A0A1G6P1T2_9PROT|nr:recombinase family protein [Belnapia rosea]SDC73999.1 Site-specific DNA recombinase [Belnapia rosea]
MNVRMISYLRVSGGRGQTAAGLGIEGQRQSVAEYIAATGAKLEQEFVEVESGKRADRPQLAAALAMARMTGSILVVARLCRLSRDAHFLLGLEQSGVEFVACDMPAANRLTVRLMAILAQEERERISTATKRALRAAREVRGIRLGGWRGGPKVDPALGRAALKKAADAFARDVGPVAAEMRLNGLSLRQIASYMAERGIRTPRGGAWTAASVRALLARNAEIIVEAARKKSFASFTISAVT